MNIDNMLDRLDAPSAESWVPEEGDKLIIKVTGKDATRGKYGDYVVLTGEVQKGSTLNGELLSLPQERSLHCLGFVLSNEVGYQSGNDDDPQGQWIDKGKVPIGATFGVKYNGTATSSTGRQYKDWKTAVEIPTVADHLEDSADEAELFG